MPAPGPTERQPGETDRAYQAFRIYLEAGPKRSTALVGRELGHNSKRQSEKWCVRWRWVDRVRQFENQAGRVADRATLDVIADRSRRQAELAQLHQEIGGIIGRQLVKRIQQDPSIVEKMALDELIRAWAVGARQHPRQVVAERLALGISTDNPAEANASRTAAEEAAKRLSDEELEARLAGFDELGEQRRKRERQRKTG